MATYTIDSVQDLIDLTLLLGKFEGILWKNNLFKLTTDLDLTGVNPLEDGTGWFPIGTWDSGSWFNGFFDGQGYIISNMTINRVANQQGLFGSFDGDGGDNVDSSDNAAVTNAGGFVLITQATKFQDTRVGMLVNVTNWNGGTYDIGFSFVTARTDNSIILDLVYVDDVVNGVVTAVGTKASPTNNPVKNLGLIDIDITAASNIGGMVGSTLGPGISNETPIKNCYVTGQITTTRQAGGFIGLSNNGYFINCWADVDITVTSTNGRVEVGGFIGSDTIGTDCVNCYGAGAIVHDNPGDANGDTHIGGFIGEADDNTYSTNSFWDKTTSLQSSDGTLGNATGKTTAEMKLEGTFINWDFDDIWWMPDGEYPALRVFEGVEEDSDDENVSSESTTSVITNVSSDLFLTSPTSTASGIFISNGSTTQVSNDSIQLEVIQSGNEITNTSVLTFRGTAIITLTSPYPLRIYSNRTTSVKDKVFVGKPFFNDNSTNRAEIRYTVNGKKPSLSSKIYKKALVFKQNTSGSDRVVLKYRVYYKGKKSAITTIIFRIIKGNSKEIYEFGPLQD